MGTLANTWLDLGNASFYSAVAPIAIGGLLGFFKPWLPTESEILIRINQRRHTLLEGTCKALHRVLTQVLTIPGPAQLRGQPPNEPDIIADYVVENFRMFAVFRELQLIQMGIKRCYTLFFITAAIGVLALLIALPFEPSRPYVAIVSYALIICQIYFVALVRRLAKELEIHEQTT